MRHVVPITLTVLAAALWGVVWTGARAPAPGNVPERVEASLAGFALSSPVKVESIRREQPTYAASEAGQETQTAETAETAEAAETVPAAAEAAPEPQAALEDAACLEWGPVGMTDLQRVRPAIQEIGWVDRMRMLSVPEHFAAWSGPYKDEEAARKAASQMASRGCADAVPVFVRREGWGVRLGTFPSAADASAWLQEAAPRCRITSPAVRHERPEADAVRLVFQPLTPDENAKVRGALSTLGRPQVCPQFD